VTVAISTHQLRKDYGAGRGVFDLDLDVSEGDVFGFLGPNGAGKTTTIRMMVWTVSTAALAAFLVSLVGATVGLITKSAQLSGLLRGLPGDVHLVLLGVIWFTFAEAIIAVLSVTHVARWANEDGSGFLEMELTEPRSRWGVPCERAAELALTLTVVSFLAAAMILIVAPQQGIVVPVGALLTATGLLLPFGLTFAAVGALLAGWRPRLTVAVLATVAVGSYLLFELAPIFRWPSWVADLSVFQLYGTPLSTPVFVGGLVAMLVIIVAGFGAAGFALSRRDVAA
jgi:ABC-type transport system involved in multi-copper enzyme maturation permease subunit